jgi:hypothetical protein
MLDLFFTQYELALLKEYLDILFVEVCNFGNAQHLHDMAILHGLSQAARVIEGFIIK